MTKPWKRIRGYINPSCPDKTMEENKGLHKPELSWKKIRGSVTHSS